MNKTILITGGAGFFGSILKKELLELGYLCVSIDIEPDKYQHENFIPILGDVRDKSLLKSVFKKYKFDAIFHCAALLAHVKKDLKNLWSSNVNGTENIVSFAKEYDVKKIVFISTNCLWGQGFDKLVKEDEQPKPIEIYGKSKLEAEKILLSAKEKINVVIFRCPTIIDEERLGLLGILFEFIEENRKIWMVGDGKNRYQFIYAKDLASSCIKALTYDKTDILNIGSDDVKNFNEIYEYVIRKSNSKSKLVHMPKIFMKIGMKIAYMFGVSPLGPYQYKMICESFIFDTTKIKRELDFQPTLKNEEMLLKAFEYYKKNKEEILNRKNVSAHRQIAKMGIIKLIKIFS